jgi:hypothetical protein
MAVPYFSLIPEHYAAAIVNMRQRKKEMHDLSSIKQALSRLTICCELLEHHSFKYSYPMFPLKHTDI